MNAHQKCAGCPNILPKREFLKCFNCKAKYDLDCANVSTKLFNIMERKDQWCCPECTNKKPKQGNINTPIRNINTSEGYSRECSTTNVTKQNTDDNVTLREKPKASTQPLTHTPATRDHPDFEGMRDFMLEELKLHLSDLFRTQMSGVREAISSLTDTIRAQNTRIQQLEAKVLELESKPPQSVLTLQNTIGQLTCKIHEQEQASLSNDVEISGCPESVNENPVHIVMMVASKIGVTLDERDIVSVERAGPKLVGDKDQIPNRGRALVVRLTRRGARDAILRAARVRRGLNTDGLQLPGPAAATPVPIYVNERLTRHGRLIFQRARFLARELKYKYVWTREGKIYVRQEHGKERHRLCLESDLMRVFGKI